MTEHEDLLINIYNDLRKKLEVGDKYSLIKASGLIRQLLLDATPLIDLVNRDYRVKIVFKIHKNKPKFNDFVDRNGQKWETVIGVTLMNPNHNDEEYISYVKRDAFLDYPVINFAGLDFNVQEIIKICAHVYGGIHTGKIEDQKDYYLDWANKTISYGDGINCAVKSIGEITEVILDALKPLVDAIHDKNK
jgi:hypothetical protein